MKRFIIRMKNESNASAIRAYTMGDWKDFPKTAKQAVKSAFLSKDELKNTMVMEVTFKRARK